MFARLLCHCTCLCRKRTNTPTPRSSLRRREGRNEIKHVLTYVDVGHGDSGKYYSNIHVLRKWDVNISRHAGCTRLASKYIHKACLCKISKMSPTLSLNNVFEITLNI